MSVANAQADFALGLLREIGAQNEGKSVVYSPISVAIVLSMVYAGAENDTAEELGRVLGGNASADDIHKHFAALVQSTQNASNANYTLDTVNKAYVSEKFDILASYKSLVQQFYGGQFESVDFSASDKTAKLINEFVKEKTHDKIANLIPAEMLDELTMLVLVNAIYFKGSWADKFDSNLTKNATFFTSESSEKQVEMMHKHQENGKYFENDVLKCLALPYSGAEITAHFILPRQRFALAKVLESLDGEMLADIVTSERQEKVNIQLPKFRVESKHDLKATLENMGVKKIFSRQADLGGMSSLSLQVSALIQKAFIKTDEAGSEAAAASAGFVQLRASMAQPRVFDFRADEPFAFFLADARKNILFGGIIRGE